MSTAPRARSRSVLAACVAVVLALAGCSSDDDAGPAPVNPTLAQIEEATGLDFPESREDYRSVNVNEREVDIAFTMAAADVESFAAASGLDLVDDQRLIAHSSPVWPEQNPTGDLRSAERTLGDVTTRVEVRTDGSDRASVRVAVTWR